MEEQLLTHAKIWGTIAVVHITSTGMDDYNVLASIFVQVCGGIASLSVAWWHIYKKSKK